jgi:hypothetical protein
MTTPEALPAFPQPLPVDLGHPATGTAEGLVARLGGLAATRYGVYCTLSIMIWDPASTMTYEFVGITRRLPRYAMRIWAEAGELVATPHLLSGRGPGGAGPLKSLRHELGFSVDVASLSGPLTVVLQWSELGTDLRLTASADELQAAARRADVWV